MDTPQISISNDQIMRSFAMQYHDELTKNILPFWLNHSIDHTYGGFFTCLDQKEMYMTLINLYGCKAGKCGALVSCIKM